MNIKSNVKNLRAIIKGQNYIQDEDKIYKKRTISNPTEEEKSLSFNITPEDEEIKKEIITNPYISTNIIMSDTECIYY